MHPLRHRLIAVLFVLSVPVAADEMPWVPLRGAGIAEALTGRVVQYANGWQDFRASGRTLYHRGRDSWGYWEVRGDMYCSMWPPSDFWACYGMTRQGDRVRFIGAAGDITEGALRGAGE